MAVIGWKLDRASREFLFDIFPPRWKELIGDHVTLDANALRHDPPPPDAEATVIGHADDGEGLEALVVSVNGKATRPDGGIFHITWSLDRDRGRTAAESNDLLKQRGWRELAAPIKIRLIPSRL